VQRAPDPGAAVQVMEDESCVRMVDGRPLEAVITEKLRHPALVAALGHASAPSRDAHDPRIETWLLLEFCDCGSLIVRAARALIGWWTACVWTMNSLYKPLWMLQLSACLLRLALSHCKSHKGASWCVGRCSEGCLRPCPWVAPRLPRRPGFFILALESERRWPGGALAVFEGRAGARPRTPWSAAGSPRTAPWCAAAWTMGSRWRWPSRSRTAWPSCTPTTSCTGCASAAGPRRRLPDPSPTGPACFWVPTLR